jgi:hypothetical protein
LFDRRSVGATPQDVVETTMKLGASQQFRHGKPYDYHFLALRRLLDKKEPDYKD